MAGFLCGGGWLMMGAGLHTTFLSRPCATIRLKLFRQLWLKDNPRSPDSRPVNVSDA